MRLNKKNKERINQRLEKYLATKQKYAKRTAPEVSFAIKKLARKTLSGGKRVRPLLLLYSYGLWGGKMNGSIVKVAAALEMLHNYLLIHDDIIEEDDFRRSELSVPGELKKHYLKDKTKKDPRHTGTSQSLVLGDIMSAFGMGIIIETDYPGGQKLAIIDYLNKVILETIVGQYLDVSNATKKTVTEKDIIQMYKKKTARYTFVCPLYLGATLAGARENQLRAIKDFAEPLGVAYQIKNDIVGMYGPGENRAKLVSDLEEGRKTILVAKALEWLPPGQDKKYLDRILHQDQVSMMELARVKKIIVNSGSLIYAKEQIQKLIIKAKKNLERSGLPKKIKEDLINITVIAGDKAYAD